MDAFKSSLVGDEMQQTWSFTKLLGSLPTQDHPHLDGTTSSNETQSAAQDNTHSDSQSTSQDAPKTQQVDQVPQIAAITISKSGQPIKSTHGKSTHDALMAVFAKSPFKSPPISATTQTITQTTDTNLANESNPTPSTASAAASWNIWIKANGPQPALGRNVTIAEIRSVLSGVDVSTITCTNLRDRIKVDMARLCRTCWEPIVEAAMGHCGHLFCTECLIEEALRERRCPLCMQALNAVELKVIMDVSGATGDDAELGNGGRVEPRERDPDSRCPCSVVLGGRADLG